MSERIVALEIDELALAGVEAADRERVAAAATRELERLLAARPEWSVPGGEIAVVGPLHGSSPEAIGVALAQALHGEIAS
jgi:hypothetical protein